MQRTLILAGLLIAACSGPADPTRDVPKRVPTVLANLLLSEDSDEIGPVAFPHAIHSDAGAMGRERACADCHHMLSEDAETIPAPCGRCHPLEPTEGKPPDL